MAESIIHTSFAAGEISPNLFARVDLDKYHVGAELMRNFFVDYRGGASTRPGSALVDRTRFTVTKARLIPFVFSQTESYALEFGDHYIRVIYRGAEVLEATKAITGITLANPGIVNVVAHGYASGDDVYIKNCLGMTQVNNVTYRIVVTDANHFSLWDLDGNPIDTSGFPPYTGGGLVARVYTITSPWTWQDLPLLKFVQSADVMTLTHKSYDIYNLSRTSPSTFVLAAEVIGPKLTQPVISAVTPSVAGTLDYGYSVVARSATGELSPPSAIVVGSSKALDPLAAAAVVNDITWGAVAGGDDYLIYKYGPLPTGHPAPTILGFIGQTSAVQFTDINIAPDFSDNPPDFRNPFASAKHPGCVSYFQSRRCYGDLATSPEEIDMSRTGAYSNFDVSFTVNDSDAIQIALAARQVNEIKAMVPMSSGLVVLTSGGAFQITGGTAQTAVTPTNITALPQASTGANDLPPIVVNYDILFVQSKGAIVRDLAYNFYLQTFYGFDRSALANHLFFGFQLLEWTYAEEPFKLVWAVRNDGRLLCLTYVPEQEVYAWTHHDTQGVYESICSIPEGDEDAVYSIVQRPYLGDNRARFIERFASRKFVRAEDAWCVDSGASRLLDRPGFGLNMTASVNETGGNAFVQATAAPPFDATWLNRVIWLDVGGKLTILTVSSPDQIVCRIDEPLGNIIENTNPLRFFQVDSGAWEEGAAVLTLSGLSHLAGQQVEVLADGMSVGPLMVSAQGDITLVEPAVKIIAGLGFQCQLKTLYLDVGDPTIQGKRKKIAAVTVRCDQSRGLKAGESFSTLRVIKEQPAANYTPPYGLFSGDERVVTNGAWNTGGQVCVQQDYPLPATVLGLIPEVIFGDTQR